MKDKQSNKKFIIIIVILVVIILLLGGYIVKDKFLTKQEKNVNTEEKTQKETKDNDELVEESIEMTEKALKNYLDRIGPDSKIISEDEVTVDTISLSEKIGYINPYISPKVKRSSDYSYEYIKEDDLKNMVNEVYGPNTYQKTTFNLGCGTFSLNEKTKLYTAQTGCGGTSATFESNEMINYKATKSKLEIVTAYAIYDGTTNKIYKDAAQKEVVGSYSSDGDTEEIQNYLDNYVKENKDKLNHITYKFESNDGDHYYFKGFTNK